MTYFIDTEGSSITREGVRAPRYVGPFGFSDDAEAWATEHIFSGSWMVFPLTPPAVLEGLRESARGETVSLGSFSQYADGEVSS